MTTTPHPTTENPFNPPLDPVPGPKVSAARALLGAAIALAAPSSMWWAVSYAPEGWAEYLLWSLNLMPVPGLVGLLRPVSSLAHPSAPRDGAERRSGPDRTYGDLLRLHLVNAAVGWVGTMLAAIAVSGRWRSVPRPSAFLVAVVLCLSGHLAWTWAVARWKRVNRPVHP